MQWVVTHVLIKTGNYYNLSRKLNTIKPQTPRLGHSQPANNCFESIVWRCVKRILGPEFHLSVLCVQNQKQEVNKSLAQMYYGCLPVLHHPLLTVLLRVCCWRRFIAEANSVVTFLKWLVVALPFLLWKSKRLTKLRLNYLNYISILHSLDPMPTAL